MAMKSKVRGSDKDVPGCVIYGFFGIFALLGSVAFAFLTVMPIYNLISAQSWDATPCTIQSSSVGTHRGEDGNTYSIDITYAYEVDGVPYDGDRYNFNIGSSSGYDSKSKVVAAYPVGLETTCYVDAGDPTRSVINRSPGWYLLWGLFPMPFMLVGYGGIAWTLFAGRVARGKSVEDIPQLMRSSPSPFGGSAAHPPVGNTQSLKPQSSKVGRLVMMLCIALFWNGIVSVFLFAVLIPSFQEGNPEWFLAIFLVPFVLIGLALIGGVGHTFLGLFNPTVHLDIHDGFITPGETCPVHWRFEGRAGRIRRLTITFEGQESATYRRGTSTYTDHHVFFSQELLSTDHPSMIGQGNCELRVPQRTVPTFESANNRIEWRVKVHGDIPHWPDVEETLPVTIHPPEGGGRWTV